MLKLVLKVSLWPNILIILFIFAFFYWRIIALQCWFLLENNMNQLDVYIYPGFPGDSDGKESACNVGDLGSRPGLGRYPGEGNSNTL